MSRLSVTFPCTVLISLAALLASVFSASAGPAAAYHDNTGRDDVLTGGIKMIPITTPSGTFRVWTKRTGNNPRIKLLLLHGGPGASHDYFQAFDSFMPAAGVEYYYYDQLDSGRSDRPKDKSLWTVPRYVEEVEQVRKALGLNKDNFYLLGHSWGGILAMEYALKYQKNLKGLIISDMMSSLPAYDRYAKEVLAKKLDPKVLEEIRALEAAKDFDNPRYEELLMKNYYTQHILRLPLDQWPEPVNYAFAHLNRALYVYMQGPSEMGIGGTLATWDRSKDIHKIQVPTLVTVARYDTMDPHHMRWMVEQLPKGRALDLPEGSHFSMYDDQERYFKGLIRFLMDVDKGKF